jgi:NADH-quinone oxidoreductase subunit K
MSNFLILYNSLEFLFFLILSIGVAGIVFNYKNIVVMLISIELSLLAVNLSFIFSSIILNDIMGILFALLILTIAAAEAAIGLAILVLFYRIRSTILIDSKYYLKG